jgi:hypothetical protein
VPWLGANGQNQNGNGRRRFVFGRAGTEHKVEV